MVAHHYVSCGGVSELDLVREVFDFRVVWTCLQQQHRSAGVFGQAGREYGTRGACSYDDRVGLNPAYKADEFEFYLRDLEAKVLVTAQGSESPAVAVAEGNGIPVLRLCRDDGDPAGTFSLRGPDFDAQLRDADLDDADLDDAQLDDIDPAEFAEPSDTALVLHTSGTIKRQN